MAADLLLALQHERQVAGQLRAGLEIGLDGFEVGEVLALVVAGAAGVQKTAGDARLERRRLPEFKGLGRLHVIVAIDHEVRPAGAAFSGGSCHDDRMAGGFDQPGLQVPCGGNDPSATGRN